MPRRRRSQKPLIPGLGWMLLLFLAVAAWLGVFGALARWTRFERVPVAESAPGDS
jgi:hypothetical protein